MMNNQQATFNQPNKNTQPFFQETENESMHSWRETEAVGEPDRSNEASAPNVGHYRRRNEIPQANKRDLGQVMKEVQELKRARKVKTSIGMRKSTLFLWRFK